MSVENKNHPGEEISNDRLHIYRPEVERNISREIKPAPSRTTNLDHVGRPGERGEGYRPEHPEPYQPGIEKPENREIRPTQPEKQHQQPAATREPENKTVRPTLPEREHQAGTKRPEKKNARSTLPEEERRPPAERPEKRSILPESNENRHSSVTPEKAQPSGEKNNIQRQRPGTRKRISH